MVQDCPHCYSRVMPDEAGTCPSCQADVHDTEGLDLSVTKVDLFAGQKLPKVCCSCGMDTPESEHWTDKQRTGGEPFWIRMLVLLTAWASFLDTRVSGTVRHLDLAIPRCAGCQSLGPLEPIHIDHNRRRISLLVKRSFAQQIPARR